MKKVLVMIGVLCVFAVAANATAAGMQITEWMYKGTDGEFAEFTNMGPTAIDMSNWYWSDSTLSYPHVHITGIGVVQPGESVIYTELAASTFRTDWGLASTVQVWGGNTTDNLGSGDAIKIYNGPNGTGVLVDQLSYGGPSTDSKSCTIPVGDLNLTSAPGTWALASAGDAYGSWTSLHGNIGNPGTYYAAPASTPEPSSMLAFMSGFVGLCGFAIRRRK